MKTANKFQFLGLCLVGVMLSPASAQMVTFKTLDKVTAKISRLETEVGRAQAVVQDDVDENAGIASLVGRPLSEIEKIFIGETLKLAGGNREQTAEMLGIGERTLYRKIKEYKLH